MVQKKNTKETTKAYLKGVTSDSLRNRYSYLQIKYPAEDYFDDAHPNRVVVEGNEKQTDSLMKDIQDSGFTAIVGVGTPAQKLHCIMDTGSSIMFVK